MLMKTCVAYQTKSLEDCKVTSAVVELREAQAINVIAVNTSQSLSPKRELASKCELLYHLKVNINDFSYTPSDIPVV